jgi:hypothetical protein
MAEAKSNPNEAIWEQIFAIYSLSLTVILPLTHFDILATS